MLRSCRAVNERGAKGCHPLAVRVDASGDTGIGDVVGVERVILDGHVIKIVRAWLQTKLQLELACCIGTVFWLRISKAVLLPCGVEHHGPRRRVAVTGRLAGLGRARDEGGSAVRAVEAHKGEAEGDVHW